MRKINPNKVTVPNEIKYSNITAHVANITNPLNEPDENIYKGKTIVNGLVVNTVSKALKNKYHKKCGYCETYETNPQVEHHRPKGFVTGGGNYANGNRNKGYHWLAYEWTNMVASCSRCNGKKYKGTKFPVNVQPSLRKLKHPMDGGTIHFSKYRYNNNYLKAEYPKILHPEYCYPIKHFRCERDGEFKHITDRGFNSIDVYGLNDETLIIGRLELYNGYLNRIITLVNKRFRPVNPITRENLKEDLGVIYIEIVQRGNDVTKSFTFFNKELYKKFDYFFIQTFNNPLIQNELRVVFIEILNELN